MRYNILQHVLDNDMVFVQVASTLSERAMSNAKSRAVRQRRVFWSWTGTVVLISRFHQASGYAATFRTSIPMVLIARKNVLTIRVRRHLRFMRNGTWVSRTT